MSEAEDFDAGGVTHNQITQISASYVPSRCLSSGVQLGVFSHLNAGCKTAGEVARAAGATERGMRMLLDSLAAFGLLNKAGEEYELTLSSAKYLVREADEYVGAMMETDALYKAWSNLTEVIRTGRPELKIEHAADAEAFFPALVKGLHVMNREPARRAAAALGAADGPGCRALDVACGSGIWGIAIAEADPEARVTYQDYSGVLETTREYVAKHKVTERAEFVAGDLKKVDFGEERFDIALLGNIVHSEGEKSSRDLFIRLHRALRPGGKIAVIDMIPNEDRDGPAFAVSFALTMLLHTEFGDTYTFGEYTEWLRAAGFPRVETADIGSHSPLIIGIKA